MNNVLPFTTVNRANTVNSALPATMTSREIAELTGKSHAHVCRDIRTMFSELEKDVSKFGSIYSDAYNRPQTEYALDQELSITLVSGYDTKMRLTIIRRWKELEGHVVVEKPLSASAALLQSVQLLVALEERCVVIEQAQSSITDRLESVEQTNVWKVCPTAAESIVHIRKRINIKHGLSASIVDEVMRQSVYAPKPSGTVHNNNEYAGNSHYAVYWKKDVSKVFELFMKETKQETACRFSHPIISGNFKANFV